MQPAAITGTDCKLHDLIALGKRPVVALELRLTQLRHGLPADTEHFEGSTQPLRMMRMDLRCQLRVYCHKLRVDMGPAESFRFLLNLPAHLGISRWHFCQALQQRLEIEHGATDQQGNFSLCHDSRNLPLSIGTKISSRIG